MLFHKSNRISYSQCWEDAELLLNALKIDEKDVVCSITSGGDNSLSILSQKPANLNVIDKNEQQNFLFELKLAIINAFNCERIHEVIGVKKTIKNKDWFNSIEGMLGKECRMFWKDNQRLLGQGVLHIGKFERYLQYFRKYILSIAHNRKTVNKLFVTKSEEEQALFYDKLWNNWRWNVLFRIFFSKWLMKVLGRGREMFRFAEKSSISSYFLEKTKTALINNNLFNNPYLEYIFYSGYMNALPHYLNKSSVDNIKAGVTNIMIDTGNLLKVLTTKPDNYYTKYNLSDVFEPLSIEETNEIFREIVRTGKDNAIIIFWNNLVPRDIPNHLLQHFIRKNSLENELKINEKVFFYDCFKIYQLQK